MVTLRDINLVLKLVNHYNLEKVRVTLQEINANQCNVLSMSVIKPSAFTGVENI